MVMTATLFVVNATTGKTLAISLRKFDIDGTEGDYWDQTNTQWDASEPTYADKKIDLTEGSDEDAGKYTVGALPAFETYTGKVIYQVHDEDNSNVTVASDTFDLVSGAPAPELVDTLGATWSSTTDTLEAIKDASAVTVISAKIVNPARTFDMMDTGSGIESPNIVEIGQDVATTVAFDFSRVLNPGTGVSTGAIAASADLSYDNIIPSQDRMQIHVDITATSSGQRTLTATATTTDSQSLAGDGTLSVGG